MSGLITIYALCEPDTNEIRYIGQTVNPDKRLYFHIVESRSTTTQRKSQWINRLVAQGTPPIFVPICVVDADNADETEVSEILKAKESGFNLLNRRAMAIGGVAKQRKQRKVINTQINIRASALLQSQLDALTETLGTSITETISIAIDRMYQQEIKTMTQWTPDRIRSERPQFKVIDGSGRHIVNAVPTDMQDGRDTANLVVMGHAGITSQPGVSLDDIAQAMNGDKPLDLLPYAYMPDPNDNGLTKQIRNHLPTTE